MNFCLKVTQSTLDTIKALSNRYAKKFPKGNQSYSLPTPQTWPPEMFFLLSAESAIFGTTMTLK